VEQRIDVTYGGEDRPRPLRIVLSGGLRFYDGDELLFATSSRGFLRAVLDVAQDVPGAVGEWAQMCRGGIPGSG